MKKGLKGLFVGAAVATAAVSLSACVPGTADKAKEKLSKDGYTVVVVQKGSPEFDMIMGIGTAYTGLESSVTAIKGDESVSAFYFDSATNAKFFYEKSKALNDDENTVIKRSGKVVYGGTKEAVKAFN